MLNLKIILSVYLIIGNMASAKPIQEITETRDTPETQIPAVFSDLSSAAFKPAEIQKAVCTVTSGDVRASAEAFTTRELKGVCTSSEMLKAFTALENKLSHELQNLQNLLKDIHRQFALSNSIERQLNDTSGEPIETNNIVTEATLKFQTIPTENKQQKTIELSKSYYLTPILKSLSTKDGRTKITAAREKEISKYNNTFIANKDVKVYSYYWRIENFTQNIKSLKSLSKQSPIFSIRGKAFKIKAHFQYLHRDYLYLQLEDYSSTSQLSLGNSIILDTGGIFKEINSDNLKYKMSILDQNKRPSSDLVSQEFDNYETGFSIPNSALIDSPFIKDNSLLIQLFLYL